MLREGEMNKELSLTIPVQAQANLLLAVVEGRITQFVRSGFKRSPIEHWNNQWTLLASMFN